MVTLSTLSNTASIFLRDVIRSNITDIVSPARTGSDWIFKGQPKKKAIVYPHIIITSANRNNANLTLDNTKRINKELNVNVEIWAEKIYDRDTLADQIEDILTTPTNTDGTNSIKSQHLHFKTITDSDEDFYRSETSLVRVKRMTFKFVYIGN